MIQGKHRLKLEVVMAPVLILQFMSDDAPAYLGTWLQGHGIESDVRAATIGAAFPEHIDGYRALALLGGIMSVNDDLPFLRTAERLIDQAMRANIPVLGHCLGGQLIAKALGAEVGASPAPEVGWHAMETASSPLRDAWFGPPASHRVFHWHYEAFALPQGATRLGSSPQCPNQAFAIGPHLALQFHLEVDAAKVELWLGQPDAQYLDAQSRWPTVHAPSRIRGESRDHLPAQEALADRVYTRWLVNAGLLPQ